jgi:hypothetical protein
MIHKHPEIITHKIFHYLLEMEPNSLKQNIVVTNFIKALLANPSINYDYTMYLNSLDINSIRYNFVRIVISNYKEWIGNFILKRSDGSTDDEYYDNYLKQSFTNLAIMFGELYKKNILKDEIINSMIEWSELNMKNKIEACMLFLINGKVDIANLSKQEAQLIKNVIPDNLKKVKISVRSELTTYFETMFQRNITMDEISALKN